MKDDIVYEQLYPIMQQCGATVPASEFYWAVNLAYHEFESVTYEQDHSDMIDDLPLLWNRLLSPLLNVPQHSIQWLDIGCGTGVLGNIFSKFLGNKIQKALCVDPSAAMIDQCRQSSVTWPFPTDFLVGTIDIGPDLGQFNLVTANSVMHHVVELNVFCRQVVKLVADGGFFATCYDPRYEAGFDKIYLRREAIYRKARESKRKFGNIYRRLRKKNLPDSKLAFETNRKLIAKGVITKPLDIRSIWAVTDFHVPNQPGSIGQGISMQELQDALQPMRLEEYYTFQYFGDIKPIYPFQILENVFRQKDDEHGQLFGSCWLKPK